MNHTYVQVQMHITHYMYVWIRKGIAFIRKVRSIAPVLPALRAVRNYNSIFRHFSSGPVIRAGIYSICGNMTTQYGMT